MSHTHESIRTPNPAERRQAARKSLMLRSAKVVCQSGEYVCLIRDVSELGTSLSFLHEAPTEPRIILALANGLTFPIEKIWSGRRQAGYRFASRVSLEEFMQESAPFALRPIRLKLQAAARIADGRFSHSARLLDLSTHGAKFECEGLLKRGHLIGFQAEGMAQQLGQIVWSEETGAPFRYGFEFQHPLELKELARLALRMQPFDPKSDSAFTASPKRASVA